jgi:uncharacterized protein YjbI with pentapeptide repeats
MATSESVDWDVCERCSEDGGLGICLPSGGKCWAHATESDLEPALKQLRESGRLDARGVPITQELLERLLASAPRNDDGHPILTDARFDEAAFHASAIFSWVIFQGETIFSGATFEAVARFNGATFCGDVGFRATFRGEAIFSGVTFQAVASMHEATFQDFARFDDATFQGFAGFERAAFLGDAMFRRASFQDVAWFTGATFHGTSWFETAIFQGDAHFRRTSFEGFAYFDRTTFQRDAGFGGAIFQASALLNQVTFQQARQLGSMLVHKSLVLDQAVFHERVQIEASAWAVCCRRARFLAGVQLRARWAQVVLDDADLAAPSLLIGVPAGFGPDEERFARAWRRLLPPRVRDGRPRLLSLRRADVAGLTVSNVDLRACRFLGAHNLDKLRSEGNARFGFTRSALATSRQTIAEEHHWRISRDATSSWRVLRRGWYPAHYQPPDWLEVEAASRHRPRACIARCGRAGRTTKMSPARPISTTARWRCAATPATSRPARTGRRGTRGRGQRPRPSTQSSGCTGSYPATDCERGELSRHLGSCS